MTEEWEQNIIKALVKSIEEDKASSVEPTYNKAFFANHLKYRPIYHFIGDMIMAEINPKSVIDWGCGCGFLLERIYGHGVLDVLGIDSSKEVQNFWNDELREELVKQLKVASVLEYKAKKKYDLAVCMEVGEHINEMYVDALVKKIVGLADTIWWTAAQPGQGGEGHINCQPLSYWESVFDDAGFDVDWEFTCKLKTDMLRNHGLCLGFPWFRDNCLIFRAR